jgi:branched-chain amino acid transport system permease protein
MGSTYGVLFAAAILTYLPEWLRDFHIGGINFSDFRMSIYSLVLILLMLTRPQGLFGDFKLGRWVSRIRSRRQQPSTTLEG